MNYVVRIFARNALGELEHEGHVLGPGQLCAIVTDALRDSHVSGWERVRVTYEPDATDAAGSRPGL